MKIILLASVLILTACSSAIEPPTEQVLQPRLNKVEHDNNIKRAASGEVITVANIQKDLVQLAHYIDTIHPEPSYTMDMQQVKLAISELSNNVTQPMTQFESWKYLSQLNPLFNDAHMQIKYPDSSEMRKQHLANGGLLFPAKVMIDSAKRLFVTEVKKADKRLQVGDEIIAINGVSTVTIVNEMLDRIYGDSPKHRISMASQAFSSMYWMLFGDTGTYELAVISNQVDRKVILKGKSELDFELNLPLSDIVQRKILDNGIGYIKIDQFYYSPEQESGFFDFINETWKVFHHANVNDVIIDVRNNPGGTDHYWMQGIAPFVANKAFSLISGFKVRMTERNLRLGPVKGEAGTVVGGPLEYLIQVDNDNPYHIPGKAYLLMGAMSYSSTNLFLTSMQDAKEAVVVADKNKNSARSCTTGRIETMTLAASKLEVILPTAIFIRPAGASLCQQPIKPDMHIAEDPMNPLNAISSLAAAIVLSRN